MATQEKTPFRDYIVEVAKVIEGAASQDYPKVQAYAVQLAERLAQSGEQQCAKRIQQALGKAAVTTLSLARGGNALPRIPADTESRVPTADEEHLERGGLELFLPKEAMEMVQRLLIYTKNASRLAASGVPISCSMILFGPPGCGKTHTAKFIAAELELPLITARMDGVVSSYLGSTAKNLRALFEHAMSRPCVLFLDEFDAIAKMRDDSHELGELKRVVISLLQNIDAMGKDHVLLAATNHEHLLDVAIWRRFTYKLRLTEPNSDLRRSMLQHFFREFGNDDVIATVTDATDGLTGAHLRQIADECIRSAVLSGSSSVSPIDALRSVLSVRGTVVPSNADEFITILRRLNPKQFTQQKLAEMFDISQPRVSQILHANGGKRKL